MRSRLFLRRSTAAVGIYVSAVLGFLGTVVAAHAFGTRFGLYAIVLAAAGFFQTLLDLTIEEALVKYGFRYQENARWGKLRRLFEGAVAVKLAGGVLAGLALLALAPLARGLFDHGGLAAPLVVVAALPLAQALENVAGVALILRGRYDLRSLFLALSMALRLAAIVVGSRYGLTETIAAIVVAQVLATGAIVVAGWSAFRRNPRAAAEPLGEDRRELRTFLLQSTVATGIGALRTTLPTLLVGTVASTVQAGWFRAAQSPQQGLASLSAPARIILLTEQTRHWERGTREAVFAGVRRYTLGASVLMAVAVPPLIVFMPDLARLLWGGANEGAADAARIVLVAGALQLVIGWSKSLPVSIGRPKLRIWALGVETAVMLPLVVVLAAVWGATGAAAAVLASTIAFVAFWAFLFARIRAEPSPPRLDPPETELAVGPTEALV